MNIVVAFQRVINVFIIIVIMMMMMVMMIKQVIILEQIWKDIY